MLRGSIRYLCLIVGVILTLPFGLLAILERRLLSSEILFHVGAHAVALVPGVPGNFIRAGYYLLALESFHPTAIVSFGSYFSCRGARIGARSGLGAYCIVGLADIGTDVRIASRVSITSGLHEHGDAASRSGGQDVKGHKQRVTIGNGAWIGEGACVGADVGSDTTVSMGAVVTKPVPEGCLAMGNPARMLPTARSQVAKS
jgi:virginiamycin A acetyltransferase